MSDTLDRLLDAPNPDPATCAFRQVAHTWRAVSTAFDRALKPAGLTANQFDLLMTLARGGEFNVKSLARALHMDPSTVPRAIGPLTRDGLIDVWPGQNRRHRIISITRRGRAVLAKAYPRWKAAQTQVVSALGAGLWDSTIKELGQLRRALEDFGRDAQVAPYGNDGGGSNAVRLSHT